MNHAKFASSALLLVMFLALTSSTSALAQTIGAGFGNLIQHQGKCTTSAGHGKLVTNCSPSPTGKCTTSAGLGRLVINCNPSPTTEFLTFVECSGTNGNHNVHCTVHDSGITDINCLVANPAISGGNNVGNCLTNNGIHLTCVIPPQPGIFPCTRQ
jgi:hypothetical protein